MRGFIGLHQCSGSMRPTLPRLRDQVERPLSFRSTTGHRRCRSSASSPRENLTLTPSPQNRTLLGRTNPGLSPKGAEFGVPRRRKIEPSLGGQTQISAQRLKDLLLRTSQRKWLTSSPRGNAHDRSDACDTICRSIDLDQPIGSAGTELFLMVRSLIWRLPAIIADLAIAGFPLDIPGTTKLARLKENIAATEIVLTADELKAIDAILPRNAASGARYPG
jgi:hypothetical protein